MNILKIFGFFFALIMAYSTFLNYKKRDFSKIQFLFWETIWIILIFIVFFTNIITEAIRAMGFIRLMDFLTVVGFIIVITLSFYNYLYINKTKKEIENIVRKDSFKDLDK
jgi:hypothetical protein